MIGGFETFNDDGTTRLSVTDYFARSVGVLPVVLPSGYANRFISGSVYSATLLEGEPFAYFVPDGADKTPIGGGHNYCFITPVITFNNGTMTWSYTRTASTDFVQKNFRDGPQDGVIYYGVM